MGATAGGHAGGPGRSRAASCCMPPAQAHPRRPRRRDRRCGDRALDGRRHGAAPRRSTRSATRRSRSACRSRTCSARFRHRHRRRRHQVHAGARADRQRDGPRHPHPHRHRRRPRLHPALAAPVPLAHRLRPAAAAGVPHIGAVIARTLGPKQPAVPAFIDIGQTVEGAGEIGTLKAFHTAGFLGTEYGPFLIIDPQDAASAVRPPKELDDQRFAQPPRALRAAARAGAGRPARQRLSSASRCSGRSTTRTAC